MCLVRVLHLCGLQVLVLLPTVPILLACASACAPGLWRHDRNSYLRLKGLRRDCGQIQSTMVSSPSSRASPLTSKKSKCAWSSRACRSNLCV
ncbi:hypothetical protein K437DRAFT_94926 [Tilletiaria anomala UBC 951]|uniref:Secreted protein n=1 Tax=Tilletiaria anomala (strain ATCC 24038 / CBS 436.72 / UBC 951) TaxID=1037660 RepID=A0A066WGT2_TILAU|nr:uncharacterized protein K437DRAFT_94926 [Tilletiaria anomala UBC 951]KDN53207.1 hypothetical protein K437DRAFT_94926 [Tilletiaria anomala UBC 951]